MHGPRRPHPGSVLWISGKSRAEDKYKGSFHFNHSVFRKEVLEVSFIFSLGENEVFHFAAISDRSFSNVLSSVLPGLCINFMAELFQNHPRATLADSPCPTDHFPLLVDVWVILERFCYQMYESLSNKGANTQKNVYKANVFVMFGDLPSRSSFKH